MLTAMLYDAKKDDSVLDMPPGYREDSGRNVCYVEDIDPKFHQGKEITCAWSATLILINLLCSDTADKMAYLCDKDPERLSNIQLCKCSRHNNYVATILQENNDY